MRVHRDWLLHCFYEEHGVSGLLRCFSIACEERLECCFLLLLCAIWGERWWYVFACQSATFYRENKGLRLIESTKHSSSLEFEFKHRKKIKILFYFNRSTLNYRNFIEPYCKRLLCDSIAATRGQLIALSGVWISTIADLIRWYRLDALTYIFTY